MAQHAKLLLNKVIEDGDTAPLTRNNITLADMHSAVDVNTFRFIEHYAAENGGKAPSWALVTSTVEGFEYLPGVGDSYAYLTRKLKAESAQRDVVRWFETGEFERKLNELGGEKFISEWLLPTVESVKLRTSVRETVGTSVKDDQEKFLAEYERRKKGESFRIWKSKYSAIGEYVSGNLYTVFGKSGRGKSVTTLEDAIYAAMQGANVLIWSLEMGWYELFVRIYVSMSGEQGVTSTVIQGVNMDAGFDSRDVRLGQLNDEFEVAFRAFLDSFNDVLPGNITVRSVDEEEFSDRSLRQLESDIMTTEADYVVVDPFYYVDYEKNTSKTTGGDAANTSMKLRRLVGRLSVVCLAITQADETSASEDEEGKRELELPKREDVLKTKQLLQDAALLIGVDSDYKQGRALVGIFKGRDGKEGDTSELLYMPQYGVVKEIEMDASGFDF
ncbi:DNA helicase [Sporosarcina phage Lietuvens]|nr:DNA helicase [Sporosarcina phage Lietuvens]